MEISYYLERVNKTNIDNYLERLFQELIMKRFQPLRFVIAGNQRADEYN